MSMVGRLLMELETYQQALVGMIISINIKWSGAQRDYAFQLMI